MKIKKSYFEIMGLINRFAPILFSILLFISCSGKNGKTLLIV